MHLFFMFDEYSDKCEPAEVWQQVRIQMDAVRDPAKPRPEGEWVGGEFTRQYAYLPLSQAQSQRPSQSHPTDMTRFMQRLPPTCTETFRKRFIQSWGDYAAAVARQAEDRSKSHIPDLESFLHLRRLSSGGVPTIVLCEMDLDIPDEIRQHPTIAEMEMLAVELICIDNVSGAGLQRFGLAAN